jgi:hypothetical protein
MRPPFTEHPTPSSHHSITHSIFSINFTNLPINFSQANIFGIQKFYHWPYPTTGGIFDFHTHFKTKWRTYKQRMRTDNAYDVTFSAPETLPRRRIPLTPPTRLVCAIGNYFLDMPRTFILLLALWTLRSLKKCLCHLQYFANRYRLLVMILVNINIILFIVLRLAIFKINIMKVAHWCGVFLIYSYWCKNSWDKILFSVPLLLKVMQQNTSHLTVLHVDDLKIQTVSYYKVLVSDANKI